MGGVHTPKIASMPKNEQSELDRISELLADLDAEESLILGFDPDPSNSSLAVHSLRERRAALEEELADLWARHCNQC